MKNLIILSGGQDSVTCLYNAHSESDKVGALIFDYGQQHREEISFAKSHCERLAVPYTIIRCEDLHKVCVSGLMGKEKIVTTTQSQVLNRNLYFLVLAHTFASHSIYESLTLGISAVDNSGYRDCSKQFADAAWAALTISSGKTIALRTPLINKTKKQIWQMAHELEIVPLIVSSTLTCYNASMTLNAWGYGCGECPACILRQQGFEEYIAELKGITT